MQLTKANEMFDCKRSQRPLVLRQLRMFRALLITSILCISATSIASAATFTVTKTADTNDGVCNADCSLREAITVANGTAGNHTIAFNIPIGAGAAVIAPGSALPAITRNNIVIDGTTQTTNNGNTNSLSFGAGGTVGVDALPLSQVAGPEIEIRGNGTTATGLDVQASNVSIRGLAILGFGGEGILIGATANGVVIENNLLGSTATSFTDPGAALRNYSAIDSDGGDNGEIRNNVIGFAEARCVLLALGSTGWTIEGNECRDSGVDFDNGDGIAVNASGGTDVIGNLITGSSTQGFVDTGSTGSNLENNTITGNGVGTFSGGFPSQAIAIRNTTSDVTLYRNIIHANYGAGLSVNDGATGVTMSENSFADNGTILARDLSPASGQIGIDLNGSGDDSDLGTAPFYTINDAGDGDSGGNTLLNFPVLDTATISGGNLTLTGWSPAGATIELFIADGDPSSFGEGETHVGTFVEGSLVVVVDDDSAVTPYSGLINGLNQGSDTTNRFSFTVPVPAGVVDGTELTATGTVGQDTSEFSGVVTAVAVYEIAGTIFEDIIGNVLDGGEAVGDVNNPTVDGVNIRLYNDNGATANQPDATDTLQAGPIATAGGGGYSFAGLTDGTYWVVVDSRTVSPSAGIHASYLATTPWAEQTFGPDKGWCADGAGGTAERVGAGPCYGGIDGATDDDISTFIASEHVARVVISGGSISNVDFGFSYNVVSNVEPAWAAGLTASSYQGSIDQFVRNANSINGANAMRFVPAVPSNAAGGGGAWWRVDYTGSNIGETITDTHDADTSINGTAFDLSDGVTVRNTNPGNIGANALGGLTVGVDAAALPQVARPELEVMRSDSAAGVAFYFYSNGSTGQIPNNFAVRDVATWGFVGGVGMSGIAGMRPSGIVIERNVIGSAPDGFADPAIPGTLRGIALISTDVATVRNNLIGFVDTNGISAAATTGTAITGNEIRESGQVDGVADGINYGGSSTTGTISANLVVDSGGMGVDGTATGNLIENNTVTGSGQLGVQQAGIRQTGSGNTVRRNIITGSTGPGVIVPDSVNAISVTENQFGTNGSIAIDAVNAGGNTATGDGIMLNDGAVDAAAGNDGLDYPVIDGAVIGGGNLTVTGYARAGATIEFYEAVGAANDNNTAGNPHGEGVAYLFTATEGVADADATTGASYTDPGYGTDPNVNRFSFTVAAPGGLAVGEVISPIAYLASNGTSEFGPNFTVTAPPGAISGTVFEDTEGNVLDGGEAIGDANNPGVNGVNIRLYNDDGGTANQPDATDTLSAGPIATAGAGNYNFGSLPDGTYWVAVESATIGPTAGFNGAFVLGDVWAEQTYGPDKGWCADGAGGTAERVGAGACFGGVDGADGDDISSLTASEHVSRVVVSGGAVTDVDFGFSFNVVTNVDASTAAAATGRTGQGSLDQFIRNADAIAGNNAMRFVPAVAPNDGSGQWWRIDYAAAVNPLRTINDAGSVVDGTAFQITDGVTVRDSNGGFLGANAGGGLAVGVDNVALPQVAKPELEIKDATLAVAVAGALVPNGVGIYDLSIWGATHSVDVGTGTIDNIRVERNVIGSTPGSFTDPGGSGDYGIQANATASTAANAGLIADNLIGFLDNSGIHFETAGGGWTISGNEVTATGRVGTTWDAILLWDGQHTVTGNYVHANNSIGVDTFYDGDNLFENNTFTGNGQAGLQSAGLRLQFDGNTVRRNVITTNQGPGIIVAQRVPDNANNNLITENAFGSNGGIGIDLIVAGGNANVGDGIMLNDGATDANNGNVGLDYPVIDSAVLSGGNLTVSGFARAGVSIEFYESVGAANDNNTSGNPHGEGLAYLFTSIEGVADADATTGATYTDPGYGTDASVNRFSFTVAAPAGLVVGEEISPIAYLAANGTSEFGPSFAVTGPGVAISGTIFEDTAGNVLDGGESIGDLSNPTVNGVDIWLYNDDGATANQPDATDTLRAGPIATAGSGAYSFAGVQDGTYWVVVDSQDLGAVPAWAEQTYGPVGGWCADGAGGTAENAAAGPCYGGRRATSSDDLTTWNSGAEHIARVVVSGGAIANVDFGFSFNAVTSTRGGAAASDPGATGAQTVQGSLRQFVQNANAITGANAMRFVPAEPTNASLAGNNWWRVSISAQLPDFVDAATIIDGAAYSRVDGVTPINTNTATIGSGAAVGVAGAFNTPLLDPELEIQGDGIVSAAFNLLAAADNTEIRNTAINAFAAMAINAIGILPDPIDSLVVEDNVVGTSPASYSDNPALYTAAGIFARDLSNSTIRNNLIGWVGRGFQISFNSVDTLIESNEIRGADSWSIYLNGVASTAQQAERITLQGNLIESSPYIGTAFETQDALGDLTINQNTIRFNTGRAIRVYGANNTLTGNVISDNGGDGLMLVGLSGGDPAASSNLISQNQFGNNAGQAIDLTETGANGDDVTINDAGDPDAGANELLNFPIIESALIVGPNLVVNGFALPGTNVEFYIADADPSGFGEGVTYLFSAVEGSGADSDATSGTYGPAPINGLAQGTDTTNRFSFSVPVPGGVAVGTDLTATGTIANATSEFSGRATVSNDADLVMTKVLDPGTPGPFAEGDSITYLLTVTNNGPAQATNVSATDTYPGELTLGVPVPSAPTTYVAGTGVWTIGTLNSGASATLSLPGTVNAGTAGDAVTNTVTAATADQVDPTTVGDDLSETFTVLPFLSIDDVAQAETDSGSTTFTFTVSINQAVGYDVTFDVDTADGTATVADTDYVAISGGSGTILTGATTTTIDVTVNGDSAIEANETFVVNLSNVSGAAVTDSQGQGTINNDDGATVSVVATTDANEAGPVDGQFTVTQSATSASDTVVTYSISGTATPGGTDYTTLSGTVTILAGATTANIDVTGIVADALVEGSETIIVTLTGTDNAAVTVAASPGDTATINLLDNNTADVSIASTTNANETGPVDGQFTITQSAASASDTVITYTVAGTATAGGTDYTTLSGTVTVLAGATTATIDVTGIVADALVEGTETVIVTLTSTDNPGIAVAASPADEATISIIDANTANVSVAATTNANEAGPVDGQFTVTQSVTSVSDTVVTYTVSGTATAGGTDYASLSGSVTVPAGDTTATIDVTGIVADALVEGSETVIVTLTATDNPGITVAASPADSATIDILDNSAATVSISAVVDANEAGPVDGQFMVTQSASSVTDTVISYTVAGTATAGGTDYATLSGSVTILAGDTAATIDVTGIVADAIVEGSESVIVTLTGTDNAAITVAPSPNDTATVNILDNAGATVSVASTIDANEAGPVSGQFTVTQSASSASDTVVSYTVAGTATAGGTDYATLSGTVTVLAGATTATIDVTGINADALVEGTETVIVTLTGTDNVSITVAASPNDTATVNIFDNNAATVSVAATADASEAGPVDGRFTVTQSTTSASDTVVNYTVAGTATAGGTDYTTLSGAVTVLAGATTATIDVTGIVDDAFVEGSETVIITLTGTDNVAIAVAASPNDTATINVLDNDGATVSIASTTNGAENGPVDGVFTVTQSAASSNDTVLSYTVAGTATSASDYTALSGTVTILGGATTALITVPVIDDAVAEGIDETVVITLSAITASDPGISIAANPADTASLTIADNDADLITTKAVSNATPVEGAAITYTITVNNSAGVQATNVSLTDLLPAGVSYVSDDSGGTYDSTSGVWAIGTIDAASVATLNINATVDAGASGLAQPITNTATAAVGDQADPDTSTDVLSANITVDANADLVTTKIVDNVSPVENATIVYTISVFNNGAAQATNVSLTDLLPTGISYSGDDSGGAYNPVTGVWTIGTIDNGAIATLNISATVDTGAGALAQPITNITTAALGDQPDPDTTTDDLSEDITVNYTADIVTTKSVDVATPLAGDTVVYTLTATNNGPAPASNVSLTDLLPSGVSYLSDDGAGAYDSTTGVWAIGSLANAAVATLNISATVDAGAGLLPQPITNTTTAAIGDQADADTTGDDLVADIIVNLIDPNLIQLTKTAGRDRANVGEIVTYSIEIRNTVSNPIGAVRLSDSPSRGFKYVPGTAQLDGVTISDPTIALPLQFEIGNLPGFVDGNGNGVADPGEPGYAVLSYRMVAGSGIAPGIWTNTAIATANCDTCFVSNIASADIEIIEDTLFDLGTIIGKVFYDADNDGWQDSGEAGIEAAMVALDDGTYALTDEFGRYHFPAVKPGQRLLKINLSSLAGQAKATNGKTRIVNVTPGLMAKANFGVILDTVDKAIGEDGQFGVGVDSETTHPPLLINGSTVMPSLLVNGEPVTLASADVKLGTQEIRDVVELADGKLSKPIRFSTRVDADATVKRWKLIVNGPRDDIARTWKGKGTPPKFIEWDGVRRNGKLILSGGIYTYHLEMTTSDGQAVSSSYRLFGVNRRNSISLNLAGGAFVSGSHVLTSKAKDLLSETATAIRAYPDEIVVISGHTDSVGSDESNMALAERRARSAYDYLRKEEGLPEEQFVVQAFGESRPIAGNDTAWGRELNRRVEISGKLDSVDRARNYDPYRQPPVVRINATDIEVDESGAFRTRIDLESGQETMNVLLSTSQGRRVETVVKLPTLHIISPQGRVAIPIDRDRAMRPTEFDADSVLLQTELLGRTEPENTVEFNGEPVDIDENGLFMAPLPVRSGENYYGLVARNPTGMLRIANLKITLDDASVKEPEFVVEPVPQLALQLPPPGIPMTNSNLVVPGSTVPGNRVYINDNEIKVDADGSFTAMVELDLGENLFTARVVDQDGHAGQIEQVFEYNGNPMFFMALVDGTVSKLQTTGSLEAAGKIKRDETISRGRIAYYLKGHVLGKYLLTSAFDSGEQELGEIFSDLTAQDNDRLLTNLDPDTLYPVYGDNSTVVYDAQSQSKFYLALESETVTALIGNYALNFTDTELAGYQRTLYGASATYQSEAKDESGNSRTKAQAFYANIAQAHVRDELRATGGSLYYLSQRGVIEGSEHISVIVRDQDSGLILRRTALQQGLDYSIDYVDGRLLTNRPVSSFSADNSLVASDLLGGSAVYLQIDYETVLNGFEQTAAGGRVRQGIGERLAVGVTSIDEDQLGGEYSLKAADAEFRLSNNSRLIAEFATSEGNNSAVNVSDDGGLTYQTVTPIAGSSGDAFKIAAEIDAGEWFGHEDRLLVNTYFKRLGNGFSANSVTSEQGSEKSGFAASWEISDSNSLLGRFERQTQLAGGNENTLATLQWNFVRKLWGVAAEIEDRGGYAGDATIAAVRMTNRWTDTLSTTLQHQHTLAGLENDQSTVGVAYRATDRLTLDASATQGTKGASAQLGAQFDWRGNKFYAAQQFNDLEVGGTSNNRLVGVEAPFGQDGAVYSEYHWSRLPVGRQRQAMFGARQRFQATDGLRIEISGEHSAENATTVNTGERYALSIGATFDNDGGITFSTRNEYRKDSRTIDSEQFLSTNNMKLALGNDLSVLGKYRFSKSDSSVQASRNIDFTEASIGLAYRPVEHDRLNLLTRFTRLTNTPTEFQQASSMAGLTSDIFAVDWSYQVSQHIEWVGKQAMRWSESDEDPLQLRSRTSLSIQRLNWNMPKNLSFGTEYRLMNQDVADDERKGFVTELMWEGLDPVVLGLGYNFSDVSDNEYVDYDFSTKGPFFRLQGKF